MSRLCCNSEQLHVLLVTTHLQDATTVEHAIKQ